MLVRGRDPTNITTSDFFLTIATTNYYTYYLRFISISILAYYLLICAIEFHDKQNELIDRDKSAGNSTYTQREVRTIRFPFILLLLQYD